MNLQYFIHLSPLVIIWRQNSHKAEYWWKASISIMYPFIRNALFAEIMA